MKVKIFLSIGSNINRVVNISSAVEMLSLELSALQCSAIYRSKDIRAVGPDFFNIVISGFTSLELGCLLSWIKRIEDVLGRRRGLDKLVAIDVDLLFYGDFVGFYAGMPLPRPSVLTQPFILQPLVELEPELLHPQENKTIYNLFLAAEPSSQIFRVSDEILCRACLK